MLNENGESSFLAVSLQDVSDCGRGSNGLSASTTAVTPLSASAAALSVSCSVLFFPHCTHLPRNCSKTRGQWGFVGTLNHKAILLGFSAPVIMSLLDSYLDRMPPHDTRTPCTLSFFCVLSLRPLAVVCVV